jgi:hypothetical protein
MTDIITPQAGWYPDPTDSRAYRWWSGGAWTDHLTAAPTAESVWSGANVSGQAVAVNAEAFALADQDSSPFTSTFEGSWSNTIKPAGKNHAGVVVIVIGLVAIAAYLGSVALTFSTVIPLIPGVIGLIAAVPAFRQSRVTGNGLAISLLGVVLSGAATVLAVLPLLPALLGLPSAADITGTTTAINQAISFHSTVEKQLIAGAQKDFGQTATGAACPTDVIATSGATFSCTETLTDGSLKAVTVTVIDANGKVTWVPSVS